MKGSCEKCGSTEFLVGEHITHKATTEDGTLTAYKAVGNETYCVTCALCGEDYSEFCSEVVYA